MSPQHQVKSISLGTVIESSSLEAAVVVGCYLLQDCICQCLSRLLPRPLVFRILSDKVCLLCFGCAENFPILPLCGQALLSLALLFVCTEASPGFLSCPHGVHSRAVCFVAESRSCGPCQLPVSPSLPGRQPESQHSVETKAFSEVCNPQEKHP